MVRALQLRDRLSALLTTARTLKGPRKSPAKWVLWGEEEQGSV